MGGCVSSSAVSPSAGAPSREDKERSFAIDKQIDDDAKKFRRECKILLLGQLSPPARPSRRPRPAPLRSRPTIAPSPFPARSSPRAPADSAHLPRLRRIREIDDSEANEDYPPKRLLQRRIAALPSHHLQESVSPPVTSTVSSIIMLTPRLQTSWIQPKLSFSHCESSRWIQQKASTGSAQRITYFDDIVAHIRASSQVFADKILEYRLDADSFSSSSPLLNSSTGPPPTTSPQYGSGLSPDIVRSIESLWHDPIIPSVLDRSSEFYLMDSAP